ncbi:MAG: 30S ribosomal protein S1 [Candidatus Dadabacteria bacterium]|nr:30S ribosomal protein S1 [Candidatus Dadabacteria bacterium]
MEQKNFSQLLEESLNVPDRGNIFKGKVVRVDGEEVFIDFGFKSEGIAPIVEFYGKNGSLKVNVGDEVEVILERWRGEEGLPTLSKRRADLFKESERLERLFNGGKLLNSRIVEKVKGGLIADVGEDIEMRAFLPSSQIDLKPQGDLDRYIGKTLEAKIIKLSNEGIVISRRAYLEEQREIQRKRVLSSIKEGKPVSGKVIKIIDHGVIVDLGGVEGFIPISELSWGRVKHPSDVVSVNEEIKASVLSIDEEGKISLSLKQMKPDPWKFADIKYKPGKKIRGKAVSTTDFGVFVELEHGVEGLVHISEITWTKRFRHPKEVVHVGSRIEAVVLETDVEKRRIALSLRRIEPSPWEIFKEKNPSGTRLKGKIKNVTSKGIFVEVQEDLVGLVHSSDISWIGRINPPDAFSAGDEIEVSVIDVDVRNQRIKLGIKQLTKDPWEDALGIYKPEETVLSGKVIDIKEAGITLELDNGLQGFIRAREFDREGIRELAKEIKVGDEITAQVIGFEKTKRQINLSKRRYEERLEKERVSSILSSQGEGSVKLGDVLGDKLKSLIKEV